MNKRFYAAMGCYATLAVGAYFQLSGEVRVLLWVVLAGLAAKTWIHKKRLSGY